MRKLIHSNFELDLSSLKISDTEENSWFSDTFFTRYSFPFEIDLTTNLDVAFEFISFYNTNPVTFFNCKYVHDNQIEDAVFEIESFQNKISGTLRFGFEQLPSFDKKLSELSLDNFDLPTNTNIYNYANTIVTKSWPDVNFNFPQIHTDKYSTDDEDWTYFEKIINKRTNASPFFLNNYVDTVTDIFYNRNIIQPLPYFLHVLQRGLVDAGFELSGDILIDDRIKNATLYGDVDYFKKRVLPEIIEIYKLGIDYTSSISIVAGTVWFASYVYTLNIAKQGKYVITGKIKTFSPAAFTDDELIANIYINSTLVWQGTFNDDDEMFTFDLEEKFFVYLDNSTLTITVHSRVINYHEILDLALANLYERVNYNFIPSINNENKINLTKAVPDITFGDFVKVIKNWFNYDLRVEGNLAIMDKIEEEINYSNAIDLSFTEVKKPLRKFQQGMSFLLKFQDIENKDFSFLPVFHNRNGFVNGNYKTNEKTNTIEILALPLPKVNRTGFNTAYAFELNNSKVYLVPYNGLVNGNNYSQPNDNYLLPIVHLAYWKKWFDFRINAQLFQWPFLAWNEKILDLKVKSKIFAYNNFHIIKTLNKTEIKPDLFEIEIETESLK